MAQLTDAQLLDLAVGAGFPMIVGDKAHSPATIAVAVALAESGGDTAATNTNTNGTVDRGLWQINSVHRQFDAGRLSDPRYNASAAFQLYAARGRTFKDWVTYNKGTYKQFLPRAMKADHTAGGGTSVGAGGVTVGTGGASVDPAAAVKTLAGLDGIGRQVLVAGIALVLTLAAAALVAMGLWQLTTAPVDKTIKDVQGAAGAAALAAI